MRLAVVISVLSLCFMASVSAHAEQTELQAKAKAFFNHFIHRFADNAEPVDGALVSNCISFYDGMVNKGGAQGLTQEEMYDLFGSLMGWKLLASNKFSESSEMPQSSIDALIEAKVPMAEIEKEAGRVWAACQKVELRAHTAALEKEKVSE